MGNDVGASNEGRGGGLGQAVTLVLERVSSTSSYLWKHEWQSYAWALHARPGVVFCRVLLIRYCTALGCPSQAYPCTSSTLNGCRPFPLPQCSCTEPLCASATFPLPSLEHFVSPAQHARTWSRAAFPLRGALCNHVPAPTSPLSPLASSSPRALCLTCTTGAHMVARRKSSTWGAKGAPPLTTALVLPPRAAATLEKMRRSKKGEACKGNGLQ